MTKKRDTAANWTCRRTPNRVEMHTFYRDLWIFFCFKNPFLFESCFITAKNGEVWRGDPCQMKGSVWDLPCENVLDNDWQLWGFGLTFILMASSSDMHWISSLCRTVSSCDDPQNMGIWQVFNKQFAAGMNWSSSGSSSSSAEHIRLLTHLCATKRKRQREGGKNPSLDTCYFFRH